MSFAGHVYDMIRRNKENRELLELRRERYKDTRKKMSENSSHSDLPPVTSEEFGRVSRESKEKRENEQKYALQMKILFLSIGFLTLVLIGVLIKLFVS